MRAGFAPEARRKREVPLGKLLPSENFIAMKSGHGNFRGARQIIVVLGLENILGAARQVPGAVEILFPDYRRCYIRNKIFGFEKFPRVIPYRPRQFRAVTREIIDPETVNLGAAFEIN